MLASRSWNCNRAFVASFALSADLNQLLLNSVNSDKAVELVLHVGDIHSGSMPCTSAGILPPINTTRESSHITFSTNCESAANAGARRVGSRAALPAGERWPA